MSKVEKGKFHWQLNWKVLVFAGLFLPILLRLGFWQLERAEEKKQLLNRYNARQISAVEPFESIDHQADRQYLKVAIAGTVRTNPTLLLDNRVRQGKPGFEVINIVDTREGPVLVNRGWIQANLDRSLLPQVESLAVPEDGRLQGYLYLSPGKQLMLGEDIWDPKAAIAVIQNAEPEAVSGKMGEAFYPYTLRLAKSAGGLIADWPIVNVAPGKHTGYAVQWFAMAVTLVLLSLAANSNFYEWLKKRHANGISE